LEIIFVSLPRVSTLGNDIVLMIFIFLPWVQPKAISGNNICCVAPGFNLGDDIIRGFIHIMLWVETHAIIENNICCIAPVSTLGDDIVLNDIHIMPWVKTQGNLIQRISRL